MKNTIFKTPVCELKALNNLFIELTAKNCNQRCKHCYINFPLSRNIKDFISIDDVKNSSFEFLNEKVTHKNCFEKFTTLEQFIKEIK